MNIDNIIVTPLKLPKLEPACWDHFWKIWQRDAVEYIRNFADANGNNQKNPGWYGMVWELYPPQQVKWQQMWGVTSADYSNEFPEMRALLDQLPFKTYRVLFQSNYQDIAPHKDGLSYTDMLPYACAVRYMFHDSNIDPNFYFSDTPTGARTYLKLPSDTNAFVFNNPKIYHAADYRGKFKIIATLIIDHIDEQKWFNILEHSARSYPEHCIIKDTA